MIAKLIVYAENRADAIRKMDWALSQYVILGLQTNLSFLRDVLQHPLFVLGEIDTNFIDKYLTPWQETVPAIPDTALIAAALSEVTSQEQRIPTGGASPDSDIYSPWAHTDSFRIGG